MNGVRERECKKIREDCVEVGYRGRIFKLGETDEGKKLQ